MSEARATTADWLAVMAGTLGALMAMVDSSIVNSSLPTIQGEIGAIPSEGTWVNTAYLVAEIVVVPLTAWLQRLLGLRRLLLISSSIFTLFSIMCGLSRSLGMIVAGRIGQGFAGGVLIPIALTIVAIRLPPKQQGVGLAVTGVASLMGPITGPLIGGWLTENFSWHLAFFINVPVCIVQMLLVRVAILKEPGDMHELRNADWVGIAGMVIGLGALTTLLEEGHREQWFESQFIWRLAVTSTVGFCLIAVGQVWSKRPVIRFSLMGNPALAAAVLLLTALGITLYSNMFLTPQFLALVAGYNAFQAGEVAFLSASIAIVAAFIYPALSARVNMRIIVAGATSCIALGAFVASKLTVQSVGSHFTTSQLLFGIGTTLTAIPLQQAVLDAVSVDDAPEANSLSAVARNLGGSFALAAIAGFEDTRLDVHHWQLNAALGANDPAIQQHIADSAAFFGGGPEGLSAAYTALDGEVIAQALVMTFSDMFLMMAMIAMAVVPFVLFLRTAARRGSAFAGH